MANKVRCDSPKMVTQLLRGIWYLLLQELLRTVLIVSSGSELGEHWDKGGNWMSGWYWYIECFLLKLKWIRGRDAGSVGEKMFFGLYGVTKMTMFIVFTYVIDYLELWIVNCRWPRKTDLCVVWWMMTDERRSCGAGGVGRWYLLESWVVLVRAALE